ncbi:AraC family transcriptional regulator [Nonomuraea glycinis]|uniref:AraC family transcriptional regulator n=2 Tax=Nonomuraea glycinis TaxID=2047744 RepID=A0A918A7X9_9ACTN|nr:AraC family transcriptional regulator [Nonomuraea glycinis]
MHMERMLDPLLDVLAALNVHVTHLSGIEATGHWGLRFDAHEHIKIGAVLTGSCVLGADGEPALRLSAGDCFLMSGYQWFQVADEHSTPLDDGQRIYQASDTRIVQLGERGTDADSTLVLGASVHFLDPTVASLLAGLPVLTAIRAGTGPARAIQPLLQLCLDEADRVRIGAPVMIERLAEMLFLQAVRALVEEPGGAMPYGWLGALGDPQIGGSLVLMHRQSARRWTVAELGNAVGMSRAAFAARFKQLVGMPPLEYLLRWRMHTAARELLAGDRTVASVAAEWGYASEAGFSAAFKRTIGVPPGRYRADPMAAPALKSLNGSSAEDLVSFADA